MGTGKLSPYRKVKAVRSSMAKRLFVVAYGYRIIYLKDTKSFTILDGSILCRIVFKTLKDAVLTCKMNEGTLAKGYIEFINGVPYKRKPKFTKIIK